MTSKIRRALAFAAKVHENQKRKGSDVPYIVHPVEAAFLLQEAGAGEDVVIAGLLHDTCEDTGVTPEQIEKEFGHYVYELVMSNTENKDLSWEERKSHTINSAASEDSLDILMLLCADKLANSASMLRDYENIGSELWNRFKRGRDDQEWYYRSLVTSLKKLSGVPMYEEFCTMVNKLFANK